MKSNQKKPGGCGTLVAVIIILAGIFGVSNAIFSNSNDNKRNAETNKETTEKVYSNLSAIQEIEMLDNFIEACSQIGMDVDQITDMKQVDDWVSGPRYSFSYMGMSFRAYMYMDNTVKTIKLGVDTDIYSKGYEPYQVSDYIVDNAIAPTLMSLSEELVKETLAYPATAEFPYSGWGIGRMKNYYTLSNTVTAQNAFGVEIETPFTIKFELDAGGEANLLYFIIDGEIILDEMDSVVIPERKRIDGSSESDNTITEATLAETDMSLRKTVYTIGTVNIRSGPDTTYDIIREVSSDTALNVIAVTENNWYRLDDGTCVHPSVVTDDMPASVKKDIKEGETITLVAGELGDYGKIITLDGEEYIDFYVPLGTYTVTNNGIFCVVYITKDKYYKDDSGYMTNDVVDSIEFTENGETSTIVIGKGEHIELTLGASVALVYEG